MLKNARNERKSQMFVRAMTNGIPSERDLLLTYTIGEFYNEQSLFIEENEIKKAEWDKIKNK